MPLEMLKNMASSRKASVLILVLIMTAIGIHFKDIEWDSTTRTWLATLIIGWMGSQAAEDIVTKKRIPPTSTNTVRRTPTNPSIPRVD
jgi:hypothetical protein